MTRDQDFERRLADWLESGPVTAPSEVVDRALERTEGRGQRRGVWRWLPRGLVERWFPTHRLAQATALVALLAGVLLTSVVVSVPFVGGPGPAPQMDATRIEALAGVARVTEERIVWGLLERTLGIESGDRRIDGEALQAVELQLDPDAGATVGRGVMRLQNAWGTWEGPIDIARYPTGEEVEMASLSGSGAYDGYTYLYAIHSQPTGTERTFEGAIWPDEPPPMADPSQLP